MSGWSFLPDAPSEVKKSPEINVFHGLCCAMLRRGEGELMRTLEQRTPRRECLVDITSLVLRAVAEAGVSQGLCTVFVPHTTAGVTVNENADPDVSHDILSFLAELVPRSWPYRHVEGNSDAHIKASLVGSSVQIPVSGGRLALGTWQAVYLAEFDGPRTRKISLVVQGS